MKHLILPLLLVCFTSVFGQKEVFFEPIDSANRKVRSFQGVEGSAIPHLEKRFTTDDLDLFSLSGYVGYFYEQAIAPTWTLRLTAGMHTVFGETPQIASGFQTEWVNSIDNIFQVGVEPRWNYTFKKRYAAGKSYLNSGWFLSMPATLGISNSNLSSTYLKTLHLLPSWGFRSSLSRNLYWEGAAGLDSHVNLYKYTFSNFHPEFDYSLRLSIGYAF